MAAVDAPFGVPNNQDILRARLFGALRLEIDGRPVEPIAAMRPRALLAYLLLHPRPHPRDRLAGLFWPRVLDTSARASLRSALWQVRAALREAGGEAYLVADRGTVGIGGAGDRWIDVEEFGHLAASRDASELGRARDLAVGPLLADLSDEWALAAQDEYRDRLIEVLEHLAADAERRGDLEEGVALGRRAVAEDRLRESSHAALIRRLSLLGRRDEALVVYRRFEAVLAAELDIAPSAELRRLAAEPPPPPSPVRVPRRRRDRATPLLGREGALEEARAAWGAARAGRGCVLVVEGEAGMGKTRLVEEITALAAEQGGTVARGTSLELEGAPPLVPWSEIVRDLAEAHEAPGRRRPGRATSRARRRRSRPRGEWHRRPPPPRPSSSALGSTRRSRRWSPGVRAAPRR